MFASLPLHPALIAGLIAIVLMLVYSALRDRADKRRLRASTQPDKRLPLYNRAMALLWGLAGVCTASWLFAGGTLSELGLRAPAGMGGWASWILSGLFCAYLVYSLVQVSVSREARVSARQQISNSGDLDLVQAESPREHARFQWLAITAGITEEIVFRGFLIGTLALLMPVWAAAILATALFVGFHFYQGAAGMLRILPISATLALIFVLGGSLWPAIILHVLTDAVGGGIFHIVQKFEERDAEASPA